MSFGRRFLSCCQIHWNGWFFFYSPLLLLPLLFLKPELEYRSIFVILLAYMWFVCVEAPPAAVTACLPIVLLPLMGVMDSNTICMNFARDSNMLFLCCNFVAVTFQHSKLAPLQAYFVLRYLSCDPQKILLILMSIAYLLTSILPAAYVCAFMMPVVGAILKHLDDAGVCKAINEDIELKDDETPYPSAVANAFYIGVAYAVNIGSITSSLASESGMALREFINNDITLANLKHLFEVKYFAYSLPLSLLILLFTMFYLHLIFFGLKRLDKNSRKEVLDIIKSNLPSFNTHMFWVIFLYILSIMSVIACSILSPKINEKVLKFSANAMILCFLYYVLPSNFDFCHYFKGSAPKDYKTVPSVLQWAPTQKFTPWKTFFVYGSSSVFGMVMKTMNLHMFVGDGLLNLESKIAQQIGFVGITSVFTIMGSNSIVADIMLPMGLKAGGDTSAVALLYPITWACCLTFLLPVSSCANSFALGWGNVRTKDMIFAALGPTLFGLIMVFIMALIL